MRLLTISEYLPTTWPRWTLTPWHTTSPSFYMPYISQPFQFSTLELSADGSESNPPNSSTSARPQLMVSQAEAQNPPSPIPSGAQQITSGMPSIVRIGSHTSSVSPALHTLKHKTHHEEWSITSINPRSNNDSKLSAAVSAAVSGLKEIQAVPLPSQHPADFHALPLTHAVSRSGRPVRATNADHMQELEAFLVKSDYLKDPLNTSSNLSAIVQEDTAKHASSPSTLIEEGSSTPSETQKINGINGKDLDPSIYPTLVSHLKSDLDLQTQALNKQGCELITKLQKMRSTMVKFASNEGGANSRKEQCIDSELWNSLSTLSRQPEGVSLKTTTQHADLYLKEVQKLREEVLQAALKVEDKLLSFLKFATLEDVVNVLGSMAKVEYEPTPETWALLIKHLAQDNCAALGNAKKDGEHAEVSEASDMDAHNYSFGRRPLLNLQGTHAFDTSRNSRHALRLLFLLKDRRLRELPQELQIALLQLGAKDLTDTPTVVLLKFLTVLVTLRSSTHPIWHTDAITNQLMSRSDDLRQLLTDPVTKPRFLSTLEGLAHLGSRHGELLDLLAGIIVSEVKSLSTPFELFCVASSYEKLGHQHAALAHALAQRMLEGSKGWTANTAETVALLAGSLQGMGGDEPTAMAYALRFATKHAIRLSLPSLVSGVSASVASLNFHAVDQQSRAGRSGDRSPRSVEGVDMYPGFAPHRKAWIAAGRDFIAKAAVQLRYEGSALTLKEVNCVLKSLHLFGHSDQALLKSLEDSVVEKINRHLSGSHEVGSRDAPSVLNLGSMREDIHAIPTLAGLPQSSTLAPSVASTPGPSTMRPAVEFEHGFVLLDVLKGFKAVNHNSPVLLQAASETLLQPFLDYDKNAQLHSGLASEVGLSFNEEPNGRSSDTASSFPYESAGQAMEMNTPPLSEHLISGSKGVNTEDSDTSLLSVPTSSLTSGLQPSTHTLCNTTNNSVSTPSKTAPLTGHLPLPPLLHTLTPSQLVDALVIYTEEATSRPVSGDSERGVDEAIGERSLKGPYSIQEGLPVPHSKRGPSSGVQGSDWGEVPENAHPSADLNHDPAASLTSIVALENSQGSVSAQRSRGKEIDAPWVHNLVLAVVNRLSEEILASQSQGAMSWFQQQAQMRNATTGPGSGHCPPSDASHLSLLSLGMTQPPYGPYSLQGGHVLTAEELATVAESLSSYSQRYHQGQHQDKNGPLLLKDSSPHFGLRLLILVQESALQLASTPQGIGAATLGRLIRATESLRGSSLHGQPGLLALAPRVLSSPSSLVMTPAALINIMEACAQAQEGTGSGMGQAQVQEGTGSGMGQAQVQEGTGSGMGQAQAQEGTGSGMVPHSVHHQHLDSPSPKGAVSTHSHDNDLALSPASVLDHSHSAPDSIQSTSSPQGQMSSQVEDGQLTQSKPSEIYTFQESSLNRDSSSASNLCATPSKAVHPVPSSSSSSSSAAAALLVPPPHAPTWLTAAATLLRYRAPTLHIRDSLKMFRVIASAAAPSAQRGSRQTLDPSLSALAATIGNVLSKQLRDGRTSVRLEPSAWIEVVTALHTLGHKDSAVYKLLAQRAILIPNMFDSTWSPQHLVMVLEVYSQAGPAAAPRQLLGALSRCLVLRAADLSPEQLVGVAESVAQLLSPLQGSSDATVVEGTAPGSIHASTTDNLSRRDNHGPIGGTGEVRSEPGADTLVGFMMRPQSGALSNISSALFSHSGSAQSRPPWALQLYRALALHARLHSGKYSTEQLLRLVKASQRSGFVSIALFTDAIQRYVLMVDEESADLSDLHCLLTALATTRKESPDGRSEVRMLMYNRKLQGLLLKAWQHQKLHHGAQQKDMLPACQVAELYWSLQVTSGPISAPPPQQQQDQGFAIGVLASELAGLLPILDLRSKIRLSQTFLSSMAELDAGEVTAAEVGRTKAFGETAAAASRQSSAMISAVHKGTSTLLQALFEEVVHILATRAGSLGTSEAMEKTSAEACTKKEAEAGSLSSQHPGSTNIKGFELPAAGAAEGGGSPEAEEDALCISDDDGDDDDSGGGGPEEADEMVDGGSVESEEGFFAEDGPLGTTIKRQPSLMGPRISPFSVNQYIAHVSAAYLGQGGNDCTFIDMLAKHCLARAKSNVAVRTRPSLALFSRAPSAECMDGMEVSLLSQALSLSLLGILSERTPSLLTHSMSSSETSTPLQDPPSAQQLDRALQLSSSQASLQLVLSAVSVLAVSAPGLTGTLASCPDQQSLERAVSAFLLIRDTLERYRSSPGSGSGLLDAKEALETEHACDRAAKAGSVKMKGLIEGRKGYRKSQGYHKLTF